MKENCTTHDFSKPFDQKTLKKMSISELNLLSVEMRNLIIIKCSIFGGHLSSNLGIVPLTIALYRYYSFPKDKIFFDVSHQTYSYKILTGRPLNNLREENGIDGFSKINESKYDAYNAGHSSTALSTAMGYAISRDLNKEKYEIITVIGDGSLGNGLSLEALNNLYNFNHRIIIIINDNKMSISKTNGLISKLLTKYETNNHNENIKFIDLDIGCFYKKPLDGEDFNELLKAFEDIKNINSPIFLYVRTIKGKGYPFAESDTTGKWHHTLPFNVETGKPLNLNKNNNLDSYSNIYTNLLLKTMKSNNKLLAITPATTYNENLLKIKKEHPNRFFDVGISEEHSLVFANGLALNSYHPYVFIYSTFLQRGYDEILHDICNANKQVTLMVGHSGLIGSDGETHQGIYDASFLMGMPNICISMANDYPTLIRLFNFSLTYKYPLVIRYPFDLVKINNTNNNLPPLVYLEWNKIKEEQTKEICVISYGPKINEINKKINGITLVNAIFTYPINIDYLRTLLDYKNIVIYDPYSTISGFTIHLEDALLSLNYKGKITKCSIPNEFVTKGTIEEQEKRMKVDILSLQDIINKL